MLNVRTGTKADVIYIQLSDGIIDYTQEIDENRLLDYSNRVLNYETGTILVGVEFFSVSQGVKLDGLPEVEGLKELLVGLGMKIL